MNAHPGEGAQWLPPPFAVKHGAWRQAFGYRFQTPDRTIVVSGDTGPESHLDQQCKRCDVLVHEVYSAERFLSRFPPGARRYHAAFHTSTTELADIASKAKPKLLVLYHSWNFRNCFEITCAFSMSDANCRLAS